MDSFAHQSVNRESGRPLALLVVGYASTDESSVLSGSDVQPSVKKQSRDNTLIEADDSLMQAVSEEDANSQQGITVLLSL